VAALQRTRGQRLNPLYQHKDLQHRQQGQEAGLSTQYKCTSDARVYKRCASVQAMRECTASVHTRG
jgi:hypothetical protein